MINAFFTGLFLGLSLILAIGAQNLFVLRQGLINRHIFYVVLFCSLSDAILISIGVTGTTYFFSSLNNQLSNILYGFSALWLTIYGLIRLRSAKSINSFFEIEKSKSKGLVSTISIVAVLTFANPHVYLDTVFLIGAISQQFFGYYKLFFTVGACISSFIFFFSLGYGAKFLLPLMQKPNSWRILDVFVAIVMFTIAFKLLIAGNWLKL